MHVGNRTNQAVLDGRPAQIVLSDTGRLEILRAEHAARSRKRLRDAIASAKSRAALAKARGEVAG